MKAEDIRKRLQELALDPHEYWIITGAAMVLYGLREETHDIDLGCTEKLADELEKAYPSEKIRDGERYFRIGEDVEIMENWLEDTVIQLDGLPVISLDGLITMKKKLNREKDWRDIALIERYLSIRKDG